MRYVYIMCNGCVNSRIFQALAFIDLSINYNNSYYYYFYDYNVLTTYLLAKSVRAVNGTLLTPTFTTDRPLPDDGFLPTEARALPNL